MPCKIITNDSTFSKRGYNKNGKLLSNRNLPTFQQTS